MKKIKMILTNSYDPDPRVYKETKSLVEKGYSVEILCWDRDSRYKNNKNKFSSDKIKVTRFFDNTEYGSGLKQLLPYIKFCFNVKKYLSKESFDYLHYHDLDGGILSLCIKNKVKRIFDMHEFYDSNKKVIHYLKMLFLHKVIQNSNGIIYCVKGQKIKYNKFFQNKKSDLIANFPDINNFKNYKHIESEKLRVVFTGGVRDFKSLSTLMIAAKGLKNIEVIINGGGVQVENLKNFKEKENCNNTKITGFFEYNEISKFHSETDIIYNVCTNNRDNTQYGFGIKVQEGIALGIPIMVNKNTEIGNFVEDKNLGFTVNDGEIKELRELLIKISNNKAILKEKKMEIYKISKEYSWSVSEEKLINLYKEI